MTQPADLLDVAAHDHPDRDALLSPGARWTFADLRNSVDRAAAWLTARGVRPRATVALDVPAAAEWILTLATMRLAARSVSFAGIRGAVDLAIDHIVVDASRASRYHEVIAVPVHTAPTDLLEAGGPPADAPRVPYPRADSVVRYVLTSGTTGVPKAARFTVATLEHRMAHLDEYWTDDRRELDLMPLSTTGGLHTALACLRHATPYLAVDRIDADTLRLAADADIEVLAGSPHQVGALLAALGEHPTELRRLREVRLAGGSPSRTLVERIERTWGVPVSTVYGATESGGVTHRQLTVTDDAAVLGPVLANVEVRIVDDQGHAVRRGIEGLLEVRGRGIADGYETRAGTEAFPRGWFRSGDRATLRDDGMLVLAGRNDALVNVGGVTIDPERLDALAIAQPGIVDAATVTVERTPGMPEVAMAVIAAGDGELRALDRALRAAQPVGHPTLYVRVAAIDRTRTGKVERAAVANTVQRALGERR